MMDDVKMRPIRNGFIVSCYERSPSTKDSIGSSNYREEFHASEKDAAKALAKMARAMKKNSNSSTPSPNEA